MLNVHSYFSFKYGLHSIEDLVNWALDKKYRVMALTDINSTAGCLDFVRQATKKGLRPLLGIDFRHGATQQFTAIAKNNIGFQQLNTFLSQHLHQEILVPSEPNSTIKEAFILYPLTNIPHRQLKDNEFIAIKTHQITRVPYIKNLQREKIIASPTFTLPQSEDYAVHSVLRAIDMNTLVSKLGPNDTAEEFDLFLTKTQFIDSYKHLPQAIENLKLVLQSCSIDFKFSPEAEPQNLRTWTKSQEEDYAKVRKLCIDGLDYRYGSRPSFSIKRRIITELQIIKKMKFLSYFLISWDIVRYAREKKYYYVGRGSGANSVVAYLLRITDVDPIELDLYFERFINLFRANPPDFDIDFSSKDRDDITQYIFNKYKNAVLLATYSTFQHKAVIREVGKAFGMPPAEIENLQRNGKTDQHSKLILSYAHRLTNFPSHLSIHAGGIIISEKPIHYFTATSLPPKGFPITHFDMIIAEDVGLFKYDILAQRGLGKIKDALDIIDKNQPNRFKIDIHDINLFKQDELVKINLREANAIGCFYVESPAMRMLLTKLKAEDYLTLVAASSIIRPGVARSGMMREYILRYRIPQRRKEAHPVLYKIMPDTFGVMVYQEDVIKVAHYFAGLTLAEADVLRRGMSGKYRSREEFQQVKEKYFTNCKGKGYPEALSKDVWRQIESFAGYAFAKGHSASYAIESYQSLFLKSHYPLEFMVAVLNNGGGFYSKEFYIHEARLHGGKIELPCVNNSHTEVTIDKKTIFLGFGLVKELEVNTIASTLISRNEKGVFISIDDYIKRVSISLEQLSILIRIDAFRFTGENKKALLWRAHFLLGNTGKSQIKPSLFDPPIKNYKLPTIEQLPIENIYDQIELLGFPISAPFQLLSEKPKRYANAKHFHRYINKKIRTMGYLVTTKNTRTIKGENMYFGNFIDEEGAFVDTVHFPPVARQYPFNGRGIYVLEGVLIEEFDAVSLEVTYMKRLNYKTIDI